nr:o-succinylbenzoate synthase [Candidatus Freyrarchaeum guaymaensis]
MFISKIEVREVKMELTSPFETSFGREHEKRTIIVSVEADGEVGYGECPAGDTPFYSYETTDISWYALTRYLAPALAGREVKGGMDVPALLRRVRGYNMAKAALEEAVWDAQARRENVPLSGLLGGVKDRVESGVSVGIQESIDELVKVVGRYVEEGYPRVKVKIKPSWDLTVVHRLRMEFPEIPLMVDANGAYDISQKAVIKALDRYGLMMIEQPFGYDDLVDHAAIQKEIRTPICLDESVPSLGAVRAALKLGSCRVINVKVSRVGGLCEAVRIHDLCMSEGVPTWVGGMLETGVGRAVNVALASLPNFTLPNDISASNRYYHEDIVEPPFELNSDGTISVPRGGGLGVEVVWERLERATVRSRVFKAGG